MIRKVSKQGSLISVCMVAALTLFVSACLPSSEDPAESTTTTVAESTTTTRVQATGMNGVYFGYVISVGSETITVDFAEILTGDEATAAAEASGAPLSGDYLIINPDPSMVSFPLSTSAVFSVQILSAGSAVESQITPSDFQDVIDGTFSGGNVIGVFPGSPIPANLSIVDGVITGVQQAYLP